MITKLSSLFQFRSASYKKGLFAAMLKRFYFPGAIGMTIGFWKMGSDGGLFHTGLLTAGGLFQTGMLMAGGLFQMGMLLLGKLF